MKNDFSKFSARAYLEEYYTVLGPENRLLLDFLHRAYSKIGHQKTLLEFGGGPTIYQLLSASKDIEAIFFSDYAASCRQEVIDFILKKKTAFDWTKFSRYVQKLEGTKAAEIEERVRAKIRAVIPGDFRQSNPLAPAWYRQFDVLAMGSVVETAVATEKEFRAGVKNVLGLLKDGGFFVGYFSKNCRQWKNGQRTYYCFPINEDYVEKFFAELGLEIIEMTRTVGKDYEEEYQGIICVLARKRRG